MTHPPQRWALIAAHLVVLATIPSALWRLAVAAGATMGGEFRTDLGTSISIVFLCVVAEGAAYLTVGLVRPWGERFRGRTIPPMLVIVPFAMGTLALAAIWGYAFRDPSVPGLEFESTGWRVLFYACYLPLLAWAPLNAIALYGYWRRRVVSGARRAATQPA